MITLYDYELSGNCYKVRLFLDILKVPYVKRPVEFYPGFEHKSDALLALNPLGQLPILDDAGFVLRDAQAILSYVAQRYALISNSVVSGPGYAVLQRQPVEQRRI